MKIAVREGTEGPVYDPYSFREVTAEHNGHEVTIHLGLGEWVTVDGELDQSEQDADTVFEQLIGWRPKQLLKWKEKAQHRCSTCFGKVVDCVEGYPGETLYLCRQGHVVHTHFNLRSII